MKKSVKLAIILLSLLVLSFIMSAIAVFNNTTKAADKIFEGIYINNEYVGGKTKEEAKALLEEKFNKKFDNKKIEMFHGDKTYSIDYKSLKAHYDIEKAVNEAFLYGKSGNIISKTIERYNLKKKSHNIELQFLADTSIVEGEVKKIAKELNVEPKNAKISNVAGKFTITPDEDGKAVDEKKLIELINSSVKPEGENAKIEIPVNIVKAEVTSEALSNINTKLSSFTTSFKPTDVNRTGNIKLAASALNGTVVMPGQVFSMNKTLGPRTASKGYKEAPVIVNGKLEPGLAGGICQVSTTLYNASLLGNFQIVKRRAHGLSVAYVAPGRDATISGDAIDFQFKNIYDNPIYIEAVVGASTITVNIYGANEIPGIKVEIISEVYERIEPKIEYIQDSSLEEGKKVVEVKPIAGLKAKTYRKVYQNGKLIKTEQLGNDTYKTQNGKIRVGTKKVVSQPTSTEQTTEQNAQQAEGQGQ